VVQLVYADAVDRDCIPGSRCTVTGVPDHRAVCVLKALGHNECWDVCNLAHPDSEFQTGNVMLDIKILETVQAIRSGKSTWGSCQVPSTEQLQPNETVEFRVNATFEINDTGVDHDATDATNDTIASNDANDAVNGPPGTLDDVMNQSIAGSAVNGSSDETSGANAPNSKGGLPSTSPEDERIEKLATTAPLDELGYKKVAKLDSHAGMEAYIRRVVQNTGCRVADEAQLQGIIPYYSGERAVQSYAALEAEVYRACTGTGTWLSSLYPSSALSTQDAQSSASTLGSNAPLTEEGFQEVVRIKDELQILKYARRVVSMLHGWVVDESGLKGLLPFFSGEKSTQTLGALILEIETAMGRPESWVMKAPDELGLLQAGQEVKATGDGEDQVPATPLEPEGDVMERLQKVAEEAAKPGRSFEECPTNDMSELNTLNSTAWTTSLDEDGYEALAQLKSDCAMFQYALRVIDDIHCHLLDESGLKGLVPFYSGTQDTQDLHELRLELQGACTMEGKWLVPDVKYWANHPEERDGASAKDALLAQSRGSIRNQHRSLLSTHAKARRKRLQKKRRLKRRHHTGHASHAAHSKHASASKVLGKYKSARQSFWACKNLKIFCPPDEKRAIHARRQLP
jgi:hypothetical protein